MNLRRGDLDPPCGPAGSPLQHQAATTKPNRLRRSFRQTPQTQAEPPQSQQPDFKTPTRIPRSRAVGVFSGESSHNDSDFQHDIIWDATSPSPNRLGKRGKKQRAGAVDISEIVNRIAPKHGRPKVAEPTLQQWIGDSATIPCTPDVQVPKPKKKSPRPNGVDDLLKLAKQFDFNMFRQDEEEAEDLHQQSVELLSEDILDWENGSQIDFSPLLPGNSHPAVKPAAAATAAETDVQLQLDQYMEDDLDFLFDGPTQHVSGNLSQVSSAQPSQVKPSSSEASGKLSASSHGPTAAAAAAAAAATTNTKGASAKDEFEDDWENDDLLNDSLVLEMTQNPQSFIAPKHSSTQKPPSQVKYQRQSPANVQSAVSKVAKDTVRPRSTFKLESNPNFFVGKTQTDTRTNSKDYSSKTAGKDSQQKFSSGESVLVEAGSQRTWQTHTVKSDTRFYQRTSDAKHNTAASHTSATKTAQSFPVKPAVVSSCSETPAVSDLLDEDLSSFFLSDPVWDDLADDDLLCEMCEDLENQIQSAENISTKQTQSNQRAVLQPSNRNLQPANRNLQPSNRNLQPANRNLQPANQQTFQFKKQTPTSLPHASGRPAGGFGDGVAGGVQMMDSFGHTQAKNTSGPTHSLACAQGSSRVQSAPQGNSHRDQFTFKKPNNPVSTATSTAVGKCSAAEIELKKQQAMERRRQRLQAAQNLRAPT